MKPAGRRKNKENRKLDIQWPAGALIAVLIFEDEKHKSTKGSPSIVLAMDVEDARN